MAQLQLKALKYNRSPTNSVYARKSIIDRLTPDKTKFSAFGTNKYVEIHPFVYVVKEDNSIEDESVAMNLTQMKSLKIVEGNPIIVRPFSPPQKDFILEKLELEVDPPITKASMKILHKQLVNQVVNKSQKILTVIDGQEYTLTVKYLSGEKGMISSKTNLQFTESTVLNQNFDLKLAGLGGLDKQFKEVYQRVIHPRLHYHDLVGKGLEVKFVRGILFYGPPGTGKTALANLISLKLSNQKAKIIRGPEILNEYFGESERAVREIFEDARIDFEKHGKHSRIHVIVFDELDSIAARRGGRSIKMRDTVVSQLLTMIDGPTNLDNILVIGTTNRKDLIDPAILRSGRLEVHIEIPLPNIQERLEILQLYVSPLTLNSCLASDVNLDEIVRKTTGCSGADLQALVSNAISRAHVRDIENYKVTREDFQLALEGIKPLDQLKSMRKHEMIDLPEHREVYKKINQLVEDFQHGMCCSICLLLDGLPGTGKSFMAASIVLTENFDKFGVVEINHKHMVIATTSNLDFLKSMKLNEEFHISLNVPKLTSEGSSKVMEELFSIPLERGIRLATYIGPVAIKDLIMMLELATKVTNPDEGNISSCGTDIRSAFIMAKLMWKEPICSNEKA
ncbi:hypothetical protein V6N13_103296 [Hibiscus sabdariffa]